jgi:hypothetical protein
MCTHWTRDIARKVVLLALRPVDKLGRLNGAGKCQLSGQQGLRPVAALDSSSGSPAYVLRRSPAHGSGRFQTLHQYPYLLCKNYAGSAPATPAHDQHHSRHATSPNRRHPGLNASSQGFASHQLRNLFPSTGRYKVSCVLTSALYIQQRCKLGCIVL